MAHAPFYSAHTHSRFSAKDALPSVQDIVMKAQQLQYPALGLTDHGTMAGSVQLYKACRTAGILPMPGMEAYVAFDRGAGGRQLKTWHMGLLATNAKGYRNLVGLNNHMNESFRYKPVIDFADFAQFSEDGMLDGIAAMTGCWFGVVPTLLREGSPRSVRNVITSLSSWFGSGVYVEIQRHNVPGNEEELNSGFLHAIAQSCGVPVIITQDSHYVAYEDRRDHETLKTLTSWSGDVDDAVFPGDGYHMVDADWMAAHHTPEVYAAGMEGLTDLLSKAKVSIPELDDFTLKVPDTSKSGDPDDELITRSVEALNDAIGKKMVSAKRRKEYGDRLDEELDVVVDAGFSGYLLFTALITARMRERGIIHAVRGSASGSLLCWLIGITEFDPIAWSLRFDRFLSRDRTKPPDIDIDIEHLRRDEVIAWLSDSYTTARISTWTKLSVNDDSDEQKGSLIVRWKTRARKLGAAYDEPIPPDEWETLTSLSKFAPYSGYGVHAAGLVVAPDEASMSAIPMQWVASSKTWVTALDKDDVEAMGMLKVDLLGLKTMTALKAMHTYTGIARQDIALKDKRTYAAMSKGDVVGCFQLEGGATRSGVRRLKPTKIGDVIAAMALFRPATMDSGATEDYIRRRNGDAMVPQRHPIISEETSETYGILLYQEQAISVLRRFGLPIEDIERARKAIKASNGDIGGARDVMRDIIGKVKENSKALPIPLSEHDLLWLERALDAYSSYGFNRAHATAYGTLAYVTAWYKVHHPVAFWAAMLDAYTGAPQEAKYLAAAREAGISIRPPNVNRSLMGYSADIRNTSIRKGLLSVKGVGEKAASKLIDSAPYESLAQLADKASVSGAKGLKSGHTPAACGGVIAALGEAGALEGIPA